MSALYRPRPVRAWTYDDVARLAKTQGAPSIRGNAIERVEFGPVAGYQVGAVVMTHDDMLVEAAAGTGPGALMKMNRAQFDAVFEPVGERTLASELNRKGATIVEP